MCVKLAAAIPILVDFSFLLYCVPAVIEKLADLLLEEQDAILAANELDLEAAKTGTYRMHAHARGTTASYCARSFAITSLAIGMY